MLLFYYKYVISLQPTSTDASYTYASFINISELYSMDSVRGKKIRKRRKGENVRPVEVKKEKSLHVRWV